MNGTIELIADEEMYFRFILKAPDGTALAVSKTFPDKRAAVAGISAMRECAGMGLVNDLCPKVHAPRSSLPEGPGMPGPSNGEKDFISVDDRGKFAYHRSVQDLIDAFAFLEDAPYVMDREGNGYRLAPGTNQCLVLGPARGPVELYWLRQAWLGALNVHMDEHRLKRSYPDCLSQLLSDVFETLAIAHSSEPTGSPWTLETCDAASRPRRLQATDGRPSGRNRTEHSEVQDRSDPHTPSTLAGAADTAS